MNLELDHFFILVEPDADVAQRLLAIGMVEGAPNTHPGQGTANRRFYFSNAMLELLWVRDENEANNGPGKNLNFPKRAANPQASPFGLVLTRTDNLDTKMPFPGWAYQPDYFPPPQAFHVGNNSENLLDPLCIYVPFVEPQKRQINSSIFGSIKKVRITVACERLSDILMSTAKAQKLSLQAGEQHLMELYFVSAQEGRSSDLRPDLPIVIYW